MTSVSEEIYSTESMQAAIEENGAAFLLAMGEAGGGEQQNDASISWTLGGSTIDYHNAVVAAHLSEEELDRAIAQVEARLNAAQVPGTWHLGPSMRPADLGERLVARGWQHDGGDLGMAVQLDRLPELEQPAGCSIKQVESAADLDEWRVTLGSGFGAGPEEADWAAEVFARLGYSGEAPWRHFIAYLDGQAVGVSTLFLTPGHAGIYFVFTRPEARRKGIGAALTVHALAVGREQGAKIGVLGSSEMGQAVYARIGFQVYCTIELYLWTPRA
jgi:GNAT superfamily N-acetyltransferase